MSQLSEIEVFHGPITASQATLYVRFRGFDNAMANFGWTGQPKVCVFVDDGTLALLDVQRNVCTEIISTMRSNLTADGWFADN